MFFRFSLRRFTDFVFNSVIRKLHQINPLYHPLTTQTEIKNNMLHKNPQPCEEFIVYKKSKIDRGQSLKSEQLKLNSPLIFLMNCALINISTFTFQYTQERVCRRSLLTSTKSYRKEHIFLISGHYRPLCFSSLPYFME